MSSTENMTEVKRMDKVAYNKWILEITTQEYKGKLDAFLKVL